MSIAGRSKRKTAKQKSTKKTAKRKPDFSDFANLIHDGQPEFRHAGISEVDINSICKSPENDQLYRPVLWTDPEIIEMAQSMKQHGVKEPLVISIDGYILSGHRRHTAARRAGLKTVPVRVEPMKRSDNIDKFVVLLREYNRQRVKTIAERIREEAISVTPEDAVYEVEQLRRQKAVVEIEAMEFGDGKARAKISKAKRPMIEAIQKIVTDLRDFWPLSDRLIHYQLLNVPMLLKHASKPDSLYINDAASYDSLTELLTRMRLERLIPFHSIDDETRPHTDWVQYDEVGHYVRHELRNFLGSHFRRLLRSQPNHIEVLAEKNTLNGIVSPVCQDFRIPFTSGRGFCSLPPRGKLAQRFRDSGKQKLVLLILSDFDPAGENIAISFAQSMKRDFGIRNIHPIKVALTADLVEKYELPALAEVKKDKKGEIPPNCKKFVEKYGLHVWELEALPPTELQKLLREAIEGVLDVDAFNQEKKIEGQEQATLSALRKLVRKEFQNIEGLDGLDDFELDEDENDEVDE